MADLPCGHPEECAELADEGSSYCRWCDEVQKIRDDMALTRTNIRNWLAGEPWEQP